MAADKPPVPKAAGAPAPAEGEAVQILDALVRLANRERASDIHLEPKADQLKIRLRIDGAMVDVQGVTPQTGMQVISRVKVLARMDIAERRIPQDGQITMEVDGKVVHLRASTFPCSQGEKAVLRILAGTRYVLPFEKLGLGAEAQTLLRDVMSRPQGFLVTCGPTGAGKTSTLYGLLELVHTDDVNVVTLEDPIEVEVYGITQGQVHVRAGFTFAAGLRAILRQDPDVILVGEMRDSETAGIAMQAALTGHLVLSTLHTSDTVETIVRLIDLGVEPWIVANALSAVLSQRLVRVVCKSCIEMKPLERDFTDGKTVLIPAGTQVVEPRGCDKCMRTGYKGRTGIFEVLELDDELRELVKDKAVPRAYKEIFARRQFKSLRRAGLDCIKAGLTTVDEVRRVT
jgi:general secretion pathway protein E/type IV pilus assembly protein PilB